MPAQTQHRLRKLGFAADLYSQQPPELTYSPRLALALSALATLALIAFGFAVQRYVMPNPPRFIVENPLHNHEVLSAQTVRYREPIENDRYRVILGSAKAISATLETAAGAEIPTRWRWAQADNPVRLVDSQNVILRAGTLPQPIRGCGKDWPQRSLVIIEASYDNDADTTARQLAIRLLDKGSADQVLIGTDWRVQLRDWLGQSLSLNENTQLLVILPSEDMVDTANELKDKVSAWAVVKSADFTELAEKIDFSGAKPITELQLPWEVQQQQGSVYVYGGPKVTPDDRTGIEWATVCPGTFTMGVMDSEEGGASDNPPYTAVLDAFDIAVTETTNEQYTSLFPKRAPADKKPTVNIRWSEAREFCQNPRVGGDLPTEAQWEYAARGGSRTGWSFGDDVNQLGEYAWFEGNSSRQVQEVKTGDPNPLGLYDMHGNVWEWIRDCMVTILWN